MYTNYTNYTNYTSYKNHKNIEIFDGPEYEKNRSATAYPYEERYDDHIVKLNGLNYSNEKLSIKLDNDILSCHTMILGGIGMGKTNTFKSIVNQVSPSLTSNDIMLIFDTKGDFYKTFGVSGKDIIISNTPIEDSKGVRDAGNIWNIFLELNPSKLYETSNEIASMIFAPHVKTSANTFFPLSAKSLFAAVIRALYRIYTFDKYTKGKDSILKFKEEYLFPSNKLLKDFFRGKNIYAGVDESLRKDDTLNNIINLLSYVEEENGALGYINSNYNKESIMDGQTMGIIAELRLVVDELFIGNFAKEGSFSIRNAIAKRDGKRIFIEYDIVEGEVLSPIYSLLVDLAIKEALSPENENKNRNAYFIIDEFKLLPHLRHIDDAVNFGRSLGVKFVIGVQNISQIYENYGENRAMNILSGFLTTFAFKVSDFATRKYLTELFGTNMKIIAYLSKESKRGMVENLERGNVVEDWDIQNLKKYECIVRITNSEYNSPFFFKTLPFKKTVSRG